MADGEKLENRGSDEWREVENLPDFDEKEALERQENFDRLVDFLDRDIKVKNALYELAPLDSLYGEKAVDYSDRLDESLREIRENMTGMMNDYYQSETFEKRLREISEDAVNAGADGGKLNRFYWDDLAKMDESFIEDVNKTVKGHSLNNPHALDERAESVNEMLHLMHSAVVNDDYILRKLPVLGENENGDTLYGTAETDNQLAREILEGMAGDKESGDADIVALENRILMMVRDRGHALSMDIQKDAEGSYFVKYFIPKICNVEKVNQLPGVKRVAKKEGVNQISEATVGSFGIFVGSGVEPAKAILDFIAAVPTDKDY